MRASMILIPIAFVLGLLGLTMFPTGYAQPIAGTTAQYLPIVFRAAESPTLAPPTATATLAPTLTPTITETSAPRATVQPTGVTSSPTPVSNDTLLLNGGFEYGDNYGWEWIDGGFIVTDATYSHSGTHYALLGGSTTAEDGMRQRVRVQPGQPYLTYWYNALSSELDCFTDKGYLWVDPNPDDSTFSAEIVDSIYEFCDSKDHSAWRQKTIDLHKYAGQVVEIKFEMDTDFSISSFWSVDDVAMTSTP